MSHPVHTVKSRVAAISIFASAGMAVAKFVVGVTIGSLALISEALHSSVDVVATRSTEECSASETKARLPMASPTTNLAAAMPPLAKIEIAATRVFAV